MLMGTILMSRNLSCSLTASSSFKLLVKQQEQFVIEDQYVCTLPAILIPLISPSLEDVLLAKGSVFIVTVSVRYHEVVYGDNTVTFLN